MTMTPVLQLSAVCKREKQVRRALVAPLVPNVLDVNDQALTGSLADMRRVAQPLRTRKRLLYFAGRCLHHGLDPARGLRTHVAQELANAGPDVKVSQILCSVETITDNYNA